jgi:hypothetical protein
MMAARKSPEIPATPAKPGPPTAPKTIVDKIDSALGRIDRHFAAILRTAQRSTKTPANLERHAAAVDRLRDIVRRDLAELRARIADEKPEFSAQDQTAAPSSSTNPPRIHADETAERSITALYGPPKPPLHLSPDYRPQ